MGRDQQGNDAPVRRSDAAPLSARPPPSVYARGIPVCPLSVAAARIVFVSASEGCAEPMNVGYGGKEPAMPRIRQEACLAVRCGSSCKAGRLPAHRKRTLLRPSFDTLYIICVSGAFAGGWQSRARRQVTVLCALSAHPAAPPSFQKPERENGTAPDTASRSDQSLFILKRSKK